MTIKLKPGQRIIINSAKAMYRIMRQVLLRESELDKGKEHCWVAALARDGRLLNLELVAMGHSKTVPVEPTAVFSFALQKGAKRIIIIHNHPSGGLRPSYEDNKVTEYIYGVGELVKVPLFDHLIISEKGYFSYRESDQLDIYAGNFDVKAAQRFADNLLIDVRRLKIALANKKSEVDKLKKEIADLKRNRK